MQCDELSRLIGPYLEESLDEDLRVDLRDHLSLCPRCRREAIRVDPTLAFSVGPAEPVDDERVAALVRGVVSQVRQRRLEKELAGGRRKWLAVAAAAVIAVGVGVTSSVLLPTDPAGTGPASPARVTAEGRESAAPPRIEVDMAGEGIRVYQYASEGASGDTAVCYIVNPALES